jgi:Ulp1 family protease
MSIKYSFPQQDIVMFLCFNQASRNRFHKHRQSWNYHKEKQKLTFSPSCLSKQSHGSSAILSHSPPSLPTSNSGLTNILGHGITAKSSTLLFSPRDIPRRSYRSSTNLPSSRCNPAKPNYGTRNLYNNALFTKSPTTPLLPSFSLYSVPKRS